MEPLNRLQVANTPCKFGREQKETFDRHKQLLVSHQFLALYDPKVVLKLEADASKVWIGVVFSQVDKDGHE